jgi:hypothetical protein
MSKAQHTPGPWRIEGEGRSGQHQISGSHNLPICEIVCNYDSEETKLANAHLIAAAPDLLAALCALIEQGMEREVETGIGMVPEATPAVGLALTAIKKATHK